MRSGSAPPRCGRVGTDGLRPSAPTSKPPLAPSTWLNRTPQSVTSRSSSLLPPPGDGTGARSRIPISSPRHTPGLASWM
uniref:Uncharacterized protein n=1 Tax=Arundo donax TaxID=35708 RepID=A0A0A9HEQ7_ARUDO